jgi:hypothetical protein
MAAWHRSRRADLGLRACGLGLCAVAYLAIARLVAVAQPPQSPGALAFALAAVGFLGASAGGAMALFGSHLFDEVEISARWQHRSRGEQKTTGRMRQTEPATMAAL